MQNIISILTFLIIISACVNSQKKEIIYDPTVLKAKETSLYSDNIDWEKVNSDFIKLTDGKETAEELKVGLQYLINSLDDKHAHIRSTKDYSIFVSHQGENNTTNSRERDSYFVDTIINNVEARFSFKLLDNRIGYLKVVGIGPGNIKAQADFIRNGLLVLKEKAVDKWILDLRYNGGGNMEPMLSGLAPLLGDGEIGGAVNNKKELTRKYRIENGQFNNNGRIVCEMDSLPIISPIEKVAVLLSRYTISSGEMLAISFKGRENTKFIGEETAGYTTGNGYDSINDEFTLVISQDVFMDRNGIVYEDRVGVDEYIEFQHEINLKHDNQINKAIEWLIK